MANLAYIQLTRKCNQECRFCSNPPNKRVRSLPETKKLIDNIINFGYDGIILTGGEPTLYNELNKVIEYCKSTNVQYRLITNGQRLAGFSYLKELHKAGLSHVNVSLYSAKEKVQNFLANNPQSLKNTLAALDNLDKIGKIRVDINTVINKYNADHLCDNVKFVVSNFPFVRHFVWNNLDPLMNRASKNRDTIPRLCDFEIELNRAMEYLSRNRKTFRVERVPLCYMTEFAEFSTETRKIVKKEERMVCFLDDKGIVRQDKSMWSYDKADCCKACNLNDICAGLYQMNKFYSANELFPIFVDKNRIIEKIKCTP